MTTRTVTQFLKTFLKVKKFPLDNHLLYFDLSLDLVIIALLNDFVMKGTWFPFIILVFKGACLSKIDLRTSVSVVNVSFTVL